MNILGLSFDNHEAAATLLIDGVLVCAIQEERLSRVKSDKKFPNLSIDHCLKEAGLSLSDIDAFAYNSDSSGSKEHLCKKLGVNKSRVFLYEHHQSHAASAFFCSSFEEAVILTIDDVGKKETSSIYIGEGTTLKKLSSVASPHSIGLFYSAFTDFLGFEINEGEYKVMGMSGFGTPRYTDKIRKLVRFTHDGFEIDQSYFNFNASEEPILTPKFLAAFGAPRHIDDGFTVTKGHAERTVIKENQHYADIAASLQKVTEELIVHYARIAMKKTGLENIAMAGAVALNSLANAHIMSDLGANLYVQPAAGGSGTALGAALAHHYAYGGKRSTKLTSCLLGGAYSDDVIVEALKKQNISQFEYIEDEQQLLNTVADYLAEGSIIGWFQDRSEWGPRALGSRSILSRPFPKETQERINKKIKFREPFRPFAPAVLAEKAHLYFDIPKPTERTQPESYMLAITPVHKDKQGEIPAVTHVDGTSRLQLVWAEEQTRYRRLIELFNKKTGVPVLLNTSFNRRGEPIVETPQDALTTFLWSDLDILVLGNFIIRKKDLTPS